MKNKIISHAISTFRIVLISSLTIFTLYTVQAWVSPAVSAPNGNVGGPLTTATSTQIKTGSLGLLDSLSIGKDLIVNGTTTTNVLRILTGAGANKVLTSDASGNASWATSTSVTGSCAVGQAIIAINADGTVTCGATVSFANVTSRVVTQTWVNPGSQSAHYISCSADEAITSCTDILFKCSGATTISGKSCGSSYYPCSPAGTASPTITLIATCVK